MNGIAFTDCYYQFHPVLSDAKSPYLSPPRFHRNDYFISLRQPIFNTLFHEFHILYFILATC